MLSKRRAFSETQTGRLWTLMSRIRIMSYGNQTSCTMRVLSMCTCMYVSYSIENCKALDVLDEVQAYTCLHAALSHKRHCTFHVCSVCAAALCEGKFSMQTCKEHSLFGRPICTYSCIYHASLRHRDGG
jgi:hypothetical protein